jgi:phosphonate transport system permease protein
VSTATTAGRRPAKPRRSLAVPVGIGVFVVITLLSVSDQWGIGLDIGGIIEDLGNGRVILEQLLDPNWDFIPRTIQFSTQPPFVTGPLVETFQMAIVAAFIGCLVALPVAFFASRTTAPSRPTVVISRGILSVVRAIPDILYAIIFVAAVGIGPLPGIMALIFFNIGVVAKLLSETVDAVDEGPIEAADAGGGNRTQMVRWAVLPQVLPNYVAYSLYAFELNVRASTVLGLVGAGGIGFLLNVQKGFGQWSNISVIIIELFVIVFVIELISINLRRRLV